MQKMKYDKVYQRYVYALDEQLQKDFETLFADDSTVARAAWYSVCAGGKRVRGVLCCAVAEMLGGTHEAAVRFGSSVEMLHCYSLIHDDLPCMDNADMRRGKPACHKQFDEATALLAGDALLTAAFDAIAHSEADADQIAAAVSCLARAAGPLGMVYGQELDLAFEHKIPKRAELEKIHRNKTGALINASVRLGAIAARAPQNDQAVLAQYAQRLGLVFQIVDDVLDVTSTAEELGKPVGNDKENDKVTFATLAGVQGAMEEAKLLTKAACDSLQSVYGTRAEFLILLAQGLLSRKN